MNIQNTKKGFTLLELLIVISIIAILSVILIVALNPAETLKKARDTQRISDLAALKTAIGIYTTTVNPIDLDGTTQVSLGSGVSTATIAYSAPSDVASDCSPTAVPDSGADAGTSTFSSGDWCYHETEANYSLVDGTGWIPVDFTDITGGSPISNLPVDPTNTAATVTPTTATLVYRYVSQGNSPDTGEPATVFEIGAILESAAFGPGSTDDKSNKDGGDNPDYYEVGTNLRLVKGTTNPY